MKKLVFAALLALSTGAVFAADEVVEGPETTIEAPKPREIEAPLADVTEAPADVAAAE